MVLEIIQVQGPSGFQFLDIFFCISNNNSRSRGMLEWNTLLIDCSSQRGEHFAIDIFDLSLMVLRIIQVQGPSGFQYLDIIKLYQQQ